MTHHDPSWSASLEARAARLPHDVVVLLVGITAALHVGKLPPAIPALQRALDITLVQSGFLLSLVQLTGMAGGLLISLFADSLGLHRSVLAGLRLLAIASFTGGCALGSTPFPQTALKWLPFEAAGFTLSGVSLWRIKP